MKKLNQMTDPILKDHFRGLIYFLLILTFMFSFGTFDPSTENPLGALVGSDLLGRIEKVRSIEFAQGQGVSLAANNKWAMLRSKEVTVSNVVFIEVFGRYI